MRHVYLHIASRRTIAFRMRSSSRRRANQPLIGNIKCIAWKAKISLHVSEQRAAMSSQVLSGDTVDKVTWGVIQTMTIRLLLILTTL